MHRSKAVHSQKDVIDILHEIIPHKKSDIEFESGHASKNHWAIVPAAGYTLQTRGAIVLSSIYEHDGRDAETTSSTVTSSLSYTQNKQVIWVAQSNLWSSKNKYNFLADDRYMNYPTSVYGLGPNSVYGTKEDVTYHYIKLHHTILKNLSPMLYAGIGYYLDYYWNIKELNVPDQTISSFQQYGFNRHEIASGLNFQSIYDSRDNTVNPTKGAYASIRYRPNVKWLGSSSHWSQSIIELKKYYQFPAFTNNILGLWSYNAFTLSGKPPYLQLPSTGWDDFFNTGRGYIQGRYRGNNMMYVESEYRFGLTRNGLIGAVVFGNIQTFSDQLKNQFNKLIPGYGTGIRIKMNKYSRSNLGLDFAWGADHSRGLFVNLGEVF